jgi:hypothetical protein
MIRLRKFIMTAVGIATLTLEAGVGAHAETMIWRDANGKTVTIPRPHSYKECRENNSKYLHFSATESHAWCSAPERSWNKN